MRRFLLLTLLVPVLAFTGIASAGSGATINLVAFSTPKPVMQTLITNWLGTSDGSGDSFTQSYGGSTSQTQAIINGQPADLAFLSNALDVNTLVTHNLVNPNWKSLYGSSVANSVVAFVVRPGNPKAIAGWGTLVKPGVQVLTPDPFPSGGAKWNVLAAYGAQRKLGKTDTQATNYVKNLFTHVVQQDTSASASMNTFLAGKGDVIITYESEAYTAMLAGKISASQIIIPKQTMRIQLPMVPIVGAPSDVFNFITYVKAPDQQKIFVQKGYRPVNTAVLQDPALSVWKTRFNSGTHVYLDISMAYFGGWIKAYNTWFSPTGRMIKIEQAVGGPTS